MPNSTRIKRPLYDWSNKQEKAKQRRLKQQRILRGEQ